MPKRRSKERKPSATKTRAAARQQLLAGRGKKEKKAVATDARSRYLAALQSGASKREVDALKQAMLRKQ